MCVELTGGRKMFRMEIESLLEVFEGSGVKVLLVLEKSGVGGQWC